MKRIATVTVFIMSAASMALAQTGTSSAQRSFRLHRSEVVALKLEGSKASSARRTEILQRLLSIAIQDVDKLRNLKILNNANENDLATAYFALQPVVLESIEAVSVLDNRTIRIAYHAVRAQRILGVESATSEPKNYTKPEIIAWARALQKVLPDIRQELVKGSEALKKSS